METETFTLCAPSIAELQHVVRFAIMHRGARFYVEGECMEGAGIEDGGTVEVDFTRYPRPARRENGVYIPGDPCLCWAKAPSDYSPRLMCKAYIGVWMGHTVGTHYRQIPGTPFRMNGAFSASLILGVVRASWGKDGRVLWEHDPSEYPEDLPDHITIKGGNVDTESAFKIKRWWKE